MEEVTQSSSQIPDDPILFSDFLTNFPPNTSASIIDLSSGPPNYVMNPPRLGLYCEDEMCGGNRVFVPTFNYHHRLNEDSAAQTYILRYHCKHCEATSKLFAISCSPIAGSTGGIVLKFGEHPAFGPQTPTRLLRLFQSEIDLFLKGRRAESQGLGIGAFAYYRRVVENHKDQLIDAIIRASKRLGSDRTIVEKLELAKTQFQFTKAIEDIEIAIPESLKIEGRNPLVLLHGALSNGIHAQTDEECLEYAQSIRLVLTALAEKIGHALQEHEELSKAVKRLTEVSSKKKVAIASQREAKTDLPKT